MRRTNRQRRNRPLGFEPLESIRLLSGLTMAGNGAAEAASTLAFPLPILVALKGVTRGTYTSGSEIPDVGTTYSVHTSGKFARYGAAAVSGSLHSLGFIAQGKAGGSLLVTVAGGTLTLRLTGPAQQGFSALPNRFSYVITKGTGKFHNQVGDPVGKGTVDVIIMPQGSSTARHAQGSVTLVFHPGIVVLE